MSETSADDVVPRDPHLRAALRHAPDAQAEPPQAVSAAILRRAREAVRAGAQTDRRWFTMAGAASPMPWAGGFAGLLLAVLAGLLWWPEPLPASRRAGIVAEPRRAERTRAADATAAAARYIAIEGCERRTPIGAAAAAGARAAGDRARRRQARCSGAQGCVTVRRGTRPICGTAEQRSSGGGTPARAGRSRKA